MLAKTIESSFLKTGFYEYFIILIAVLEERQVF